MPRILKKILCVSAAVLAAVCLVQSGFPGIPLRCLAASGETEETTPEETESGGEKKDFINWIDFKVPCEAMEKAIALDAASQEQPVKLHFIELLAYLAAENGNNFSGYRDAQLDALAEKLSGGASMAELTEKMKYYSFYLEAYTAVLAGFVGEYETEVPDDDGDGTHWEKHYGLKVFSPIAKGFPYTHYKDFGKKRTYGFSRTHFGNDLFGQVGTPIIAIEGGYVEELGWNQYGGWRVGIRSFDLKRYYYYAHLRKGFPFRKDLKVGDTVESGDVIGYLGRTGCSRTEDVNNVVTPHLHLGIQVIFDESQKEGSKKIWIDVYQIVRLLDGFRSEVVKDPETKDYSRVYGYRDLSSLPRNQLPPVLQNGADGKTANDADLQ